MTRKVKSKKIKVVSVCSECGEEVASTNKDTAYRHGFKRYRLSLIGCVDGFCQEDGKPCRGSGQPVKYKKR